MNEAMKKVLELARTAVLEAENSENMRLTMRRQDRKISPTYSRMLHSGIANDEAIRRETMEAIYGRKGFSQ